MIANIFSSDWSFSANQPLVFGLLISVAILLAVLLVGHGIMARVEIRRRAVSATDSDVSFSPSDHRGSGHTERTQFARMLAEAGKLLAPGDQQALSELRKQMVTAGYFSANAIPIYFAIRIGLAVVLPTFLVLFGSRLPLDIPVAMGLIFVACLSVLGLIGPSVYLDWRRSAMRERYRQVFPDFMDLMVICVEAGQSLQGAIERVGREMAPSCPQLAANLHLLSLEFRAGRSLTEGLEGLWERLGIEEVKSLGLLLKQSEELGTSLAASLRVYSDEMRDKRLMRAEAKAQALPVKMTIPLGIFIFPVIMIVVMLPLIIRIRSSLL